MRSGGEYDALTSARRWYCYLKRPGVAKAVKKAFNKRRRRIAKQIVTTEAEETD